MIRDWTDVKPDILFRTMEKYYQPNESENKTESTVESSSATRIEDQILKLIP